MMRKVSLLEYANEVRIPYRVYESLKQTTERHIKALGLKPKLILVGNHRVKIGGDK